MSWILVFFGGGLGAMGRYAIGSLLPRAAGGFPWATFGVNLVGAFLIGLIAAHVIGRAPARLFWMVGVLGGFTTFSAFSYETITLIQQRDLGLGLVYVGASVVLGLMFCWLGLRVGGYA